ncbi:MAG: GLUG motif-containing protein [Chloroflexota bacterium]|nr:GLUG motif-containing protein [Chloroflexota bacterium]
MRAILGSRRHHYLKRVGIFLIAVALVMGLASCEGSCGAPSLYQYALAIFSTVGGITTPGGEVTFTYDEGTVVNLVATPDAGHRFVEWTGDVSAIVDAYAAETTITMNGDYSITANFVAIYDLATSSTEGGEVTTPGEGTFTYDEGTVVNLVATPDAGYRFAKWTGDVSAIADDYSAETTITMNGDYSITAEFAWQYYLSINSTAGGSVTEPGEGVFPCDEGTVVDLVAEAEESYHFVQWTGNVSTSADVYAAETTITMNDDYSVTANFILFAGGSGTAVDPYQIADWRHLDNVRNYLNHHFIVINDLDSNSAGYTELASATANEGKGWEPIGTTAEGAKFAGSFDGQGYEICDPFIDRPDENQVGLFGVVGEGGAIENVGVVNGNVTGNDDVGGLVGKNEGNVTNSSYTSSVTGDDFVGGLVGKNEGTASNSYSTGNVTGSNYVGGLIGQNSATASNSYSTGSVTGNDYVGGLIGRNDDSTASNSYSTGSVTGNDYVGGLVGKNDDTVEYSFWDTQTSGQADSDGGTGKTTEEMMDIATFTGAEWEITDVDPSETNPAYIWNIVDDETYPFLSWESVV